MKIRPAYLFYIVMLLCVSSVVYQLVAPGAEINDVVDYQLLSDNLVYHNSHYCGSLSDVPKDFRLFTKRPAVYSLFLGIGSVNTHWVVLSIQCALLMLLYFIGLMLTSKQGRKNSSTIYSILFISSIPLFFTAGFAMADLFLALIIAVLLLLLDAYSISGNRRLLWQIAFLWSLAIWCKPVMAPSVVFVFFAFFDIRRRFPIFLPAVSLAALMSFNYLLVGSFHVSSITTINKSFYNAKLVIAAEYGSDSALQYVDNELFKLPASTEDLAAYTDKLDDRAAKTILAHPMTYTRLQLMGMAKALLDPGRFEVFTFFGVNTKDKSLTESLFAGNINEVWKTLKEHPTLTVTLIILLIFSVIKLIGGARAVFLEDREWWLLLTLVYFLILAGPIGAFRFIVPAYMPYLVLSTRGLSKLLSFEKSSKS